MTTSRIGLFDTLWVLECRVNSLLVNVLDDERKWFVLLLSILFGTNTRNNNAKFPLVIFFDSLHCSLVVKCHGILSMRLQVN